MSLKNKLFICVAFSTVFVFRLVPVHATEGDDWVPIPSSNSTTSNAVSAGSVANSDWETVNSSDPRLSGNTTPISGDDWSSIPVTESGNENLQAHYIPNHNYENNAHLAIPKQLPEPQAEPLILDFSNEKNQNESVSSRQAETIAIEPITPSTEYLTTPETNIDMFVGQLIVLGKFDVTRVAIGNGGIVRAEVLKTNELLIIGQQEGSTSLRLWNKDDTQLAYNIRVGSKDPETRVHMERMVRLRVRMVEFNKRAIGKLGIDWGNNGVANGPTFAAAGDAIGNSLFRPAAEGFGNLPLQVDPFATYFGIATDITSKINFLSGNGDAVTLAEPVLSAVNGGQATFLAGGEIPYPVIGENGQTSIEFKEYGVRLQVAPRIDSGGNIRTYVETEISKVDAAVSVNGTPGLLTRRAQTEVNVRSGETIVLAGLLSSDDSTDVSGIPGIRHLPIIGRFFSSRGKSNEVRELVIFVTPEVVDPKALLQPSEQKIYEKSSKQLAKIRSSLPLME